MSDQHSTTHTDTPTFFRQLETPAAATTVTPLAIIQRQLDGLGFRLYWAFAGLRAEDYQFRPSADSMTISALSIHLGHLVRMLGKLLDCPVNTDNPENDPDNPLSNALRDQQTLAHLQLIRNQVISKDPAVLSADPVFWKLFNGPLADAISHAGQLNSWRRINGNPIAAVNFFSGKAPRDNQDV